jgi:hypothetical protein
MHTAGSHTDKNQRKELLLTAGFEPTLFGRRHFVAAIMMRDYVGALMSALLRHRSFVGTILTRRFCRAILSAPLC